MDKRSPLPSRLQIAEHWAAREPRFVSDIGEPSCFACGWFREGWHAQGCEDACSLSRIWTATRGLETAHLVPHMLGGTATAANLVLLCRACHRAAPDYADSQFMLDWMRSGDRFWGYSVTRLRTVVATFGIDPEVSGAYAACEGFRRFLHARAGIDTQGDPASTYMAALKDYTELARYF
jgi:hypothetical protein